MRSCIQHINAAAFRTMPSYSKFEIDPKVAFRTQNVRWERCRAVGDLRHK